MHCEGPSRDEHPSPSPNASFPPKAATRDCRPEEVRHAWMRDAPSPKATPHHPNICICNWWLRNRPPENRGEVAPLRRGQNVLSADDADAWAAHMSRNGGHNIGKIKHN